MFIRIFLFATFFSFLPICESDLFAQAERMKMISSETIRQDHRNSYQRVYRSMWNGKASYMFLTPILSDPEARPAMGFTEEQYQNLLAVETNIRQNHPDNVAALAELEILRKPEDPYFINASAADQKRYHELMEQISNVSRNVLPEALEQIVTPYAVKCFLWRVGAPPA